MLIIKSIYKFSGYTITDTNLKQIMTMSVLSGNSYLMMILHKDNTFDMAMKVTKQNLHR